MLAYSNTGFYNTEQKHDLKVLFCVCISRWSGRKVIHSFGRPRTDNEKLKSDLEIAEYADEMLGNTKHKF